MSSPPKEQLIACLKPVFKQNKFKKTRANWRKEIDDLIFVLNIQTSQWSKEDYYINVGIYIKDLGIEQNPPEYRCHIRDRINEQGMSCSSICDQILEWFEKHESIEKLKLLGNQNNLPAFTTVDARKYLDDFI